MKSIFPKEERLWENESSLCYGLGHGLWRDAALGLTARAATPTYTVSGYPSDNGTVTTEKTTAGAGETVTLTVTPANG